MERQKAIAPPGAVLRRYGAELRKHPLLLVSTLVAPIGLQIGGLAAPWFLGEFFDMIASAPGSFPQSAFVRVILLLSGVWLFNWAMRRWRGWAQIYLEVQVMASLTHSTLSYLLGHSVHFFSSQFSGTLTRRVTKYRDAFETLYDALTMSFIPFVVFVGGACAVLIARNVVLGMSFTLWCVLAFWFQLRVARHRQPLRERRANADSAVVGMTADSISNQTTVALFSGMAHEIRRFSVFVKRWEDATRVSWIADENSWTLQGLMTTILNIGLLWGAYYYWTLGQMTVGDFVLIQVYLMGTFDQLVGLNQVLRRVYDAFADAGEMVAILDAPHGIQDAPDAVPLAVRHGDVVFTDVSFRFHAERTILDGFLAIIPGGQKVALVGPSGAGKSTITKLLLRLYDITGGTITIDGQDIRSVTQESLRQAIGFVPQEPVLFHRTLMENIRYGRRDASDTEVIEAAKRAHCHEFITRMPHGYDTLVGERGVKLSGGERQRVAIARAILKNAPILVLDEATSSLDSESEALIQDSLKILMEGKTVIVIAHRLSTITQMDRVLVVDGGKVAADGTHEELLRQEGLYQKLWSIQAGGFIPDA